MSARHPLRSALAVACVAAGPAPLTAAATSEPAPATDAAISAERCAANEAAGEIVYLSGYNHAASASMIDVMVAEAKGYYDELCLDVTYEPSFSTQNYPLVAAGEAQFASAGSFSELLSFADSTDADLVAVLVKGNFPIDALIVTDLERTAPADLAGATIGIKGRMQASLAVLLADAGLTEGDGYETVLLDGFDPLAHAAIDDIDAFTGHFSNEPGVLDAAGVEVNVLRPADFGIPGSHGVTYSSQQFLDAHPGAAEDFVRATLRGFADAMADPEAAVAIAEQFATDAGDPSFNRDTELFRWPTEAAMIAEDSATRPLGVPEATALQAELDAYAAVDYFSAAPPPAAAAIAPLAAGVYDDGVLIWPG